MLRKRLVALAAIALLSIGMAVAPGGFVSSAQAAPFYEQCEANNDSPGLQLTCEITLTNTLNLTTGYNADPTPSGSVLSVVKCIGAAGVTGTCETTSTPSTEIVTALEQCNGAVNGGGSNVICEVTVVNNIIGGTAAATNATVNQCNASGGGGGTEPVLACIAPSPGYVTNTTNATINQCNGSANGGGGTTRVVCTVAPSTESSALRVTINQCNGSANGGGSTVTCAARMTTNLIPAAVVPEDETPGGEDETPGGEDETPGGEDETPGGEDETPATPGVPTAPVTPAAPTTPATPATPTTPAAPSTPVTQQKAPADRTRGTERLASTGADDGSLALLAAVMLGTGIALVAIRRRSIHS
ncbi:hypothetical protein [Marisediminicola senii]|uniref:hypothetical protein n=1 Tax=Marisediminicola senii TaxID=2711233 RepID=UPI0013EB65CB|nr:hypothetical protein [Marisediminicola senii]